MRKIVIAAVSAAAILSAGFSVSSPAEAMIAAPAGVGLAAQAVAPVENVWCGWRCRHHHRFHRFHHRRFFFHHHRRCWDGDWC